MSSEELALLVAGYAIYFIVVFGISFVMYILQSVGMYSIANRRGINHAWLAWIPLGSMWILGSIADDYQLKAKNAVKNRRKVLLLMPIVLVVLIFAMYVPFIAVIGEAAVNGREPSMDGIAGASVFMLAVMLAVFVLTIILTVYQYISLYELFASCDPNNKVIFLLLSILISGLSPILIFACRKKDKGLYPPAPYGYVPPQYQQPAYGQPYQPAYGQPYQPQQRTYQQPQQPTYQQPQQPTWQDPGSQQ